VRIVDSGGAETAYRYDEKHFLVEERLPDGLVYRFHNERGLSTVTAGPGGEEQTRYDAHGNPIEHADVRGAR
jgi:YD repeat-containing protein